MLVSYDDNILNCVSILYLLMGTNINNNHFKEKHIPRINCLNGKLSTWGSLFWYL